MFQIILILQIGMIVVFNVLNNNIYGKGFSIIKVVNYVWMVNSLIYIFNPVGFYNPSDESCLYSLLFVLSINISTLLFRKRSFCRSQEKVEKLINLSNDVVRKKTLLLTILSALCWLLSIGRIYAALNLISSQGMIALRTYVYHGDIYTTAEKLLYQYFVQPLFIVTILFASELLVIFRTKNNIIIYIVAICDAIVYSLLFGGRALLILMLMYFIFALVINNNGNIIQILARQRKLVLGLIVLAIMIGGYSMLRVSREWSVFSEYVVYICGGLAFFSELLGSGAIPGGILHGLGSIGCLHDFVGLILKIMGNDVELVSQVYSRYATNFIPIGDGIITNFTATAMATFYLDFGSFGIVVGGLIMGLMFSFVENMWTKEKNIFSLTLYIYFANIAFETIENYTPKSVVFVFVILYTWLFLKNKKMLPSINLSK